MSLQASDLPKRLSEIGQTTNIYYCSRLKYFEGLELGGVSSEMRQVGDNMKTRRRKEGRKINLLAVSWKTPSSLSLKRII